MLSQEGKEKGEAKHRKTEKEEEACQNQGVEDR